jgi:3-oxosteroid 1-dehydrogenase
LADQEEQSAVATYAGESTMFPIFMQTWGLFFLFLKIATVRAVVWRALGRKPVTTGKSLVAQLMLLVKNRAMRSWRAAPLAKLIVEEGRVVGAVVNREGKEVEIHARKDVLLCAGGFARNPEMRQEILPGTSK